MSAQQTEALRLARLLEQIADEGRPNWQVMDCAADELRRLHTLNLEWQQKAATWMASPAAAQRLDGYQELAQRLNAAEQQRGALLKLLRMARAKMAAELQVMVMSHTGPDGFIDDAEAVLLIEAEQDLINQIDEAIAKATGDAT